MAQSDERPRHARYPLEQQLLAVPVSHRPDGYYLIKRTVECSPDGRRAVGEVGHRVLAQRYEVQTARRPEDRLDVVEERFGTIAVTDLVDLIDSDHHPPFPAASRPQ